MNDNNLEELQDFFKQSFKTLFPNKKLYYSPYLDIIFDRLIALNNGKINRLIINMPPRFMKSLCVSIVYPVWLLGLNPSKNVIVASYSSGLAIKHSLDSRFIMNSNWYKGLFPNTIINKEQNTKIKFQTTKLGFRFATSVDGTLTGEGADLLIADDPINVSQANSAIYREKVQNWFRQTFMTRLNDRKKSSVIVVMHRLHEEDICQDLIEDDSWHILSLPMIAKEDESFFSLNNGKLIFEREKDSILNENCTDASDVSKIQREIGSYAFAAQYQQQPKKITGNLVKREWLNKYSNINFEDREITQSWDTAIGENQHNDYSVCITFSKRQNLFYIIDIFKGKINYPDLKNQIELQWQKWKAHTILIENKSSGQSLIQDLRRNSCLPIIPINVTDSKLNRLYKVISFLEGGRVYLNTHGNWQEDFERELLSFPNSKNDDQVDSFTQYLNYEMEKIYSFASIRKL